MPRYATSGAPPAGFTLVETLVALSLIAVTSAAMLPAIAAAGHLQRESAWETAAVRIAASQVERLLVTAGSAAAGGSLDAPLAGFSADIDSAGAQVSGGAYQCRWRITRGAVVVVAVRVVAPGGRDVTLSTAVRRE